MRLNNYYRSAIPRLIVLLLAAGVVAVSEVLLALSMKQAIEMLIQKEQSGLFLFLVLFGGVIVLSGVGYYWFGVQGASFKRMMLSQLKRDYGDAMFRLSMSEFSKYPSGAIASMIGSDINKIETQYFDTILKIVKQAASFLLASVALFYFSPLLTLLIYLFASFLVFAPRRMHQEMRTLGQEYSSSMADFNTKVHEILSGFMLILVSNLSSLFRGELDSLNQKSETVRYEIGVKESKISAVLALFSLTSFYVPFFLGAVFVYLGKIELGVLIAAVNLCGSIINPIQQLGIHVASLKAGRGILERFLAFIHENSGNDEKRQEEQRTNGVLSSDLGNGILLRNVGFGYNNQPILSQFSAEIQEGEKVLIVGKSGSGKSTVLKLIAGLYPNYSGSITISGQEVREMSRLSLSRCISVVPQDSFLFNRNLRDNILLGSDFNERLFEDVCREAALESVLKRLPKGADTVLGEGAQELSGGEKQRIGIARAFYRDSWIILADEPTSSLDEENSRIIYDILIGSKRTVICVAHKVPETQRDRFDRVIRLQSVTGKSEE